MDNNKDFNLIEKYLSGKLSDTEKQSFDNRLAEDESFAQELENHQTAHKALDFLVASNLKAQLQEMEAESKVVSLRKRRKTRLSILSVAASVLVLIGTFYIILPQNNLSNTELAAAYYEEPDFGTRGSTAANALNEGINALQNNDLATAITQLGEVKDSDPDYLVAQYFLGHAYYSNGQFNEAEQSFSIVGNSNDLRYVEQAQWYQLLSCLAQDASCTDQLNELIEEDNHSFHNEAVEISKRQKN